MSPEQLGLVMLAIMVFAILIGFPTAFTLMSLGVTFGFLGFAAQGNGFIVFDLVVQRTFFVMQNDTLIAIPLFLFMGYIIERAGVLEDLFKSIQLLMGRVPGSIGVATLITGALFATATGIVGASVTLLGLMSLPQMLQRGYKPSFAAGIIVAAGTLGILIPPSVLLILYGFIAGVSVPRLYAAAFAPGFILAALYVVYILWRSRDPSWAPRPTADEMTAARGEAVGLFFRGLAPIVMLIVFVLGAIFFGVATPSEGAALGAVGGLLLAAWHRKLSVQMIRESVFLTVRTAAIVGWLLVGSSIFAAVFARLGSAQVVGEFFDSLGLNATMFVLMVEVIIFVLGWPLEWTEITIIFIPLFLPILISYDVDLVWFGVLSAVNMQTAFLSPPVAMSAYYLKNVAPKSVTLNMIFQGMYPFIFIQLIALALLYIFPEESLFFSNLIYGSTFR